MTTVITITLEDDLSQEEQNSVRYLVCDAFGEFQRARGPTTEEYVDRRYPEEKYVSLMREKKVEQVRMRKKLAEKIRNAVAGGGALVTRVEPVEGSEV